MKSSKAIIRKAADIEGKTSRTIATTGYLEKLTPNEYKSELKYLGDIKSIVTKNPFYIEPIIRSAIIRLKKQKTFKNSKNRYEKLYNAIKTAKLPESVKTSQYVYSITIQNKIFELTKQVRRRDKVTKQLVTTGIGTRPLDSNTWKLPRGKGLMPKFNDGTAIALNGKVTFTVGSATPLSHSKLVERAYNFIKRSSNLYFEAVDSNNDITVGLTVKDQKTNRLDHIDDPQPPQPIITYKTANRAITMDKIPVFNHNYKHNDPSINDLSATSQQYNCLAEALFQTYKNNRHICRKDATPAMFENDLNGDYTANGLRQIHEKYNININVYDFTSINSNNLPEKLIKSYVCDGPTKIKNFNVMFNNDHVYVMDNIARGKRTLKYNNEMIPRPMPKAELKDIKLSLSKDNSPSHILVDDPTSVLKEIVRIDKQLVGNISIGGRKSGIRSFQYFYDGVRHMIEESPNYPLSILKKLGLKYKSQNLQSLAMHIFNDSSCKSHLIPRVFNFMSMNRKKAVLYQKDDAEELKKLKDKVHCFDIRRSYAGAMAHAKHPWLVFISTDQFVDATNKDLEDKNANEYLWMVKKSQNYGVFSFQHNMYSYEWVKTMIDLGYKVEVEGRMHASIQLKPDYFMKFINDVTKLNLDEDTTKELMNSFIGMLGRTKSTIQDGYLSTSDSMLCAKMINSMQRTPSITEFVDDVSLYVETYETLVYDTYLPIHEQILDIANSTTIAIWHKYFSIYAKEILYYNTDSIAFTSNDDAKVAKIMKSFAGNFRSDVKVWGTPRCDSKFEFTHHKLNTERYNNSKDEKSNLLLHQEWVSLYNERFDMDMESKEYGNAIQELVDSRLSFIVIADLPGSGKTVLINNWIKKATNNGEKVLRLSPTNKGALLIDGNTFHKSLCIQKNKPLSISKIERRLKGYTFVVVDEVFQSPEFLINILIAIKKKFSIGIIFSGAFDQAPAVQEFKCDYINSDAFKYLCDGNIIRLRKGKRALGDLLPMLVEMRDNGTLTQHNQIWNKAIFPSRNLCYTNKKRMEVIANVMNSKPKNKVITALPDEDKKEIQQQPQFVVEIGAKVYTRYTRNHKYAKNEIFTISAYDNDSVTITNERTTLKLSNNDFIMDVISAYCMTVHRIQGDVIAEDFCIHQTDMLTRELMFVAISRAREKKNIYFDSYPLQVYLQTIST